MLALSRGLPLVPLAGEPELESKASVCCQVKAVITQGFTLLFADIWVKGSEVIHKVITLFSKKLSSGNKFYFGIWRAYSKQFYI